MVALDQEIAAPARIVWEVITDVGHYPEFLTLSQQVFQANGKDVENVTAGEKYTDQRLVYGKPLDIAFTVTRMEEGSQESDTKYLTVYTNMFRVDTSSTHVIETLDDSSCLLTISYGMIPMDFLSRIVNNLRMRKRKKEAILSIKTDLEDFARESCARFKKEISS